MHVVCMETRDVDRMKGKSISWFFMIAMLLSAMMVNVSTSSQARTKLYIDPQRIPEPGQVGHPGDEYYVSVKVDNVEDLYAAGFTVKFAPYGRTLMVSSIAEGDFLSQGSYPTAFYYTINVFEGTIKVAIIRLGGVPGASGSGTLMTFKLTVVEAGESPIDLVDDILLSSNYANTIPHKTSGSYYYGATATLVNVVVLPRRAKGGENIAFWSKVRNNDNVTLYVRVRFDIYRLEDGRSFGFYAGQTYFGGGLGEPLPHTYLYCDGYHPTTEDGWTNPGTSLVGPPDGNVASSATACSVTSMYTFENITLPYLNKYSVMNNVDIEGYTRQSDASNDLDPYFWTYDEEGNVIVDWAWGDSMGGSTTWAWTGQRYYKGVYNLPEYYGFPLNETAVNNTEILLHNYGNDGVLMEIDSLRLKVEFATTVPETPPVYKLLPYQERELPPALWITDLDDTGKYIGTATIEYSEVYPDGSYHWISGNQKTFTFWIIP